MTPDCKPIIPAALLWLALVHHYCVMVIGILCNALAMWCVATCTKMGRPMKVLLFAVFLPVLLLCLVRLPMWGGMYAGFLTCDLPSRTTFTIMGAIIIFSQQVEVTTIAAIAVVRAAAVWAPYRPKLGIRGAVVLLVVTCIYAILTILVWVSVLVKWLEGGLWIITVMRFVTMTLPVLITIAAYILMIFAIQRNKRRLVAYQQPPRITITMDQATRAMLAVFISNLLFWLPYSIYLLSMPRLSNLTVMFFVIFSTHFVVDPLVFMWLNTDYRDKIMSLIKRCVQCMSCSLHPTGHDASPDRQELQTETNL